MENQRHSGNAPQSSIQSLKLLQHSLIEFKAAILPLFAEVELSALCCYSGNSIESAKLPGSRTCVRCGPLGPVAMVAWIRYVDAHTNLDRLLLQAGSGVKSAVDSDSYSQDRRMDLSLFTLRQRLFGLARGALRPILEVDTLPGSARLSMPHFIAFEKKLQRNHDKKTKLGSAHMPSLSGVLLSRLQLERTLEVWINPRFGTLARRLNCLSRSS